MKHCGLQEWGLDVQKSSFLSGLPWALSFAFANLAGFAADSLINKKVLSITATRKLMQGIASLGPATCLTLLALQPSASGSPPIPRVPLPAAAIACSCCCRWRARRCCGCAIAFAAPIACVVAHASCVAAAIDAGLGFCCWCWLTATTCELACSSQHKQPHGFTLLLLAALRGSTCWKGNSFLVLPFQQVKQWASFAAFLNRYISS